MLFPDALVVVFVEGAELIRVPATPAIANRIRNPHNRYPPRSISFKPAIWFFVIPRSRCVHGINHTNSKESTRLWCYKPNMIHDQLRVFKNLTHLSLLTYRCRAHDEPSLLDSSTAPLVRPSGRVVWLLLGS